MVEGDKHVCIRPWEIYGSNHFFLKCEATDSALNLIDAQPQYTQYK
jgi:hypothetical protein